MRSREEIEHRIREIESDERMGYEPALIDVNAPLALIQVEGKVAVAALKWALGEGAYCAGSYPHREFAEGAGEEREAGK